MILADTLLGIAGLAQEHHNIITIGSLAIFALLIIKFVFKTIKWGIIIALAIALVLLALTYLQ